MLGAGTGWYGEVFTETGPPRTGPFFSSGKKFAEVSEPPAIASLVLVCRDLDGVRGDFDGGVVAEGVQQYVVEVPVLDRVRQGETTVVARFVGALIPFPTGSGVAVPYSAASAERRTITELELVHVFDMLVLSGSDPQRTGAEDALVSVTVVRRVLLPSEGDDRGVIKKRLEQRLQFLQRLLGRSGGAADITFDGDTEKGLGRAAYGAVLS